MNGGGSDALDEGLVIDPIRPHVRAPDVPLRVPFSWTLFGFLSYTLGQWGVVSVVAKLGTPEMVGQFALGLSIAGPIVQAFNLQLRSVQVTDASDQYSIRDYLGLRLLTSGMALLVVCAILALGKFSDATTRVIFVIGLWKVIEAAAEPYAGVLQRLERMDRIALSQALRGMTGVLAVGAALFATGDLLHGLLALTSLSLGVLLVVDVRSACRLLGHDQSAKRLPLALWPQWERPQLLGLCRVGLPLGLVVLLLSVNAALPNYVVGYTLGHAQLGVFAALAFVTMVGPTAVNALGQSASARLARAYGQGDHRLFIGVTCQLLWFALVTGILGVASAATVGQTVLSVIYTEAYSTESRTFMILMTAAGVNGIASVLGVALTATRWFAVQLPLGVVVTTTTLMSCLWLAPRWGLAGAAAGLLAAAAVQSAGLLLLLLMRLSRTQRALGRSIAAGVAEDAGTVHHG